MFARLGRVVVANPWRVIAAWLVAAAGLVVFAPNLDSITNNDQTRFLPGSYESVQANEIASSAYWGLGDRCGQAAGWRRAGW
jgi:putative drug exporter of the RND superfamily